MPDFDSLGKYKSVLSFQPNHFHPIKIIQPGPIARIFQSFRDGGGCNHIQASLGQPKKLVCLLWPVWSSRSVWTKGDAVWGQYISVFLIVFLNTISRHHFTPNRSPFTRIKTQAALSRYHAESLTPFNPG